MKNLLVKMLIGMTAFLFSDGLFGQIQGLVITGPYLNDDCKLFYVIDGRQFGYEYYEVEQIEFIFGDGNSEVVEPTSQDDLGTTHMYMNSGTYFVSAVVTTFSGGMFNTPIWYVSPSFYAYSASEASNISAAYTATQNGSSVNFQYQGNTFGINMTGYILDFGDGTQTSGGSLTNGDVFAGHEYETPATYNSSLTIYYNLLDSNGDSIGSCTWVSTLEVEVLPGDECCSNFAPIVNEEYWLAAWVQEEVSPAVKTYSNSYVELEFVGSSAPNLLLYPSGDLVEGWQRIVGKFTIPANTTDLKIHLVNDRPSGDVYFDDVRVHPFNASMKSYVYDPETLWLTAELDDNNYATFYEYDGEGQLVRMKKETARGIMTIQESRSSNPKE